MHYEDTKQVQSIAKTTWNATYEGIIPLEVQINFLKLNYSDESMKLRIERSIVYVAEVEGEIVGFANYSPVRDGGKVELAAIQDALCFFLNLEKSILKLEKQLIKKPNNRNRFPLFFVYIFDIM